MNHLRHTHTEPAIETVGLTKRFDERLAVDAVNLTVPAGSAFGLLGHNGAGKTTLIRMLVGLTQPSAGQMTLLGHELPAGRERALSRVGAIVEEPMFYSHLSGRENLRVAAAVREPQAAGRIASVLERVGLSDRADDKVRKYSMGMRQRLGIARCLLSDPSLLILDEPSNGLDPGGMLEFRMMVRAMVEEEGRTLFISSHLLDEVEKICDAAAIVDRGRILATGTIAELRADGEQHSTVISCEDPNRALTLLRLRDPELGVESLPDGLRLTTNDHTRVAAVNELLVTHGIAVWRVEPAQHSLEDRFLQLTSQLKDAA